MGISKLTNYIRTYRKSIGLSQSEVAFLLGWQDASHLCRYESFARTPAVRTALALQIIFRARLMDLFAGEYQFLEVQIDRRAKRLAARLALGGSNPGTSRKLAALRNIRAMIKLNHNVKKL